MSARHWKRTRAALRPYQRDIDRRERKRYRQPWWVRLLGRVWPDVKWRHYRRWNEVHEAALRRALKTVAHATGR